MILKKFQQPFPIDTSLRHNLFIAGIFGGFVFIYNLLTDFIHRGFSFGEALRPALIVFVVLSTNFIVVPKLLPSQFTEERWTLGREVFWSLLQFIFIGAALFIYQVLVYGLPFTFGVFLKFVVGSFAVGTAPVLGIAMYEQNRLLKRHLQEAIQLNQQLNQSYQQRIPVNEILLSSENGKDVIECSTEELLFISSSDNYVEIYLYQNDQLEKKLLRSSLKRITETLATEKQFFRCHRAYLVNLSKIETINGNAQGYKLKLVHIPDPIPVARSQAKQLKQLINS
ncbi:MAG: LytR/AlgR family response regulator transcription factor [Flammeovirgaceae bacterium]